MDYVSRHAEPLLQRLATKFKVVLVTGAQQVGKSTMLRQVLGARYTYITLDNIDLQIRAREDPRLFLRNYPGPLIIDEIQRVPELFLPIKELVDSREEIGTRVVICQTQQPYVINEQSYALPVAYM